MGFANEYHVERLYRDVRLARVAPVNDELVKAFVGTNELGLPRSEWPRCPFGRPPVSPC